LGRTLAADGEDGTWPPTYEALRTSARSVGTPVVVKGAALTAAVVVGAATASLTTLAGEDNPLNAEAPTRGDDKPTEEAARDKDGKAGGMSPP
jgi:hypothetical protein